MKSAECKESEQCNSRRRFVPLRRVPSVSPRSPSSKMRVGRLDVSLNGAALFLLCSVLLLTGSASGEAKTSDNSENSGEQQGDVRLPRTRVVRTKYGQVQGRIHRVDSRVLTEIGVSLPDVEIYQGIRYATPPVGTNR